VLVRAADVDGNDRAGIRAPMVQAARGTDCGWNLRARGLVTAPCKNSSAAASRCPRRRKSGASWAIRGDRSSTRYPDAASHVTAIRAAARGLVEDGLMPEEDVKRAAAAAANWGRPRHEIRLK
jgi:hypothetical protein